VPGTIRDVAREAGVSQATAARALAGYGYVSDATRRRVRIAALTIGYRPNAVARSLVSGATKTIGVVVGDIENPFFAGAARGIADVLERDGYTLLLANSDEEGHRSALRLLERADRPSALFTVNNFMTAGALGAIRELGLRIPDDVALVGFDDLDWTTLVDPPISVVAQPVAELGRTVAERLLERLRGDAGPPRETRLTTRLVVRGSCGGHV
jgi:LacI family transcriptional regulator